MKLPRVSVQEWSIDAWPVASRATAANSSSAPSSGLQNRFDPGGRAIGQENVLARHIHSLTDFAGSNGLACWIMAPWRKAGPFLFRRNQLHWRDTSAYERSRAGCLLKQINTGLKWRPSVLLSEPTSEYSRRSRFEIEQGTAGRTLNNCNHKVDMLQQINACRRQISAISKTNSPGRPPSNRSVGRWAGSSKRTLFGLAFRGDQAVLRALEHVNAKKSVYPMKANQRKLKDFFPCGLANPKRGIPPQTEDTKNTWLVWIGWFGGPVYPLQEPVFQPTKTPNQSNGPKTGNPNNKQKHANSRPRDRLAAPPRLCRLCDPHSLPPAAWTTNPLLPFNLTPTQTRLNPAKRCDKTHQNRKQRG